MKIGLFLERNIFRPKDVIKIVLDIENCGVGIKGIRAILENKGKLVDLYDHQFNFR